MVTLFNVVVRVVFDSGVGSGVAAAILVAGKKFIESRVDRSIQATYDRDLQELRNAHAKEVERLKAELNRQQAMQAVTYAIARKLSRRVLAVRDLIRDTRNPFAVPYPWTEWDKCEPGKPPAAGRLPEVYVDRAATISKAVVRLDRALREAEAVHMNIQGLTAARRKVHEMAQKLFLSVGTMAMLKREKALGTRPAEDLAQQLAAVQSVLVIPALPTDTDGFDVALDRHVAVFSRLLAPYLGREETPESPVLNS